jgi:branched-subunit amino acid transport protein
VNEVWLVVLVVGLGTVAIKALGPVLLGGRPLPTRVSDPVGLLAPALLGALVATQALSSGGSLEIDARLVGVIAGAIALALRAPVLLVVVLAAAATALTRLVA